MKHNLQKLPNHIAFIIDGNGRWAKKRGLTRSMGHKAGIDNLDRIIKECFYEYGIHAVSIYAFSTENWNRPKAEVDYLMKAFKRYLSAGFAKKFPEVKLNVMGDTAPLPEGLAENVRKSMEETKNNTKFILNIGINYSGQDELVHAVNNIIKEGYKTVDRQIIADHLYTSGQEFPDFLVRTSGECRLSNFMLWQLAYTELYFPSKHWPEFKKKDLYLALKEYQSRDRRFGAIVEKNAEK